MKKIWMLTLLFITGTVKAENGKLLFSSRCATCHKINEVFVGPALGGVDKRRDIEWIVKFVRSSQTMVQAGDKDAVALFDKFKIKMPDHPDLTADQVKNIVDFIKVEASTAAAIVKPPFAKPLVKHPGYVPVTFADNKVGSSRVDLQACKLEYSIVSPK